MNKAFMKEDAPSNEDEEAPLPSSNKNYMTPAGFECLRQEHHQLVTLERPRMVDVVSWAASNGDRSENGDYLYGKKRLREIDRRVRYLAKRLESAIVVDPSAQLDKSRVLFGATVTYIDDSDVERTIKIVGEDEVDTQKGYVSWVSPIARALLKNRAGDVVTLHTPRGPVEIEIISIQYDE